jgi:hypothetical protein
VRARRLKYGNLVIHTEAWTSSRAICCEGNYQLFMIQTQSEGLQLVVDTGGATLDHQVLGNDVQALEFALGAPLGIADFVAVNSEHRVVGGSDPGFGATRNVDAHREPIPDTHDACCWTAVFAALVAKKMLEVRRENAPPVIGSSAYLDPLSGPVHARYLLAQVALEAVAKLVIFPRLRGQGDYAANAADCARNSNSMGLT